MIRQPCEARNGRIGSGGLNSAPRPVLGNGPGNCEFASAADETAFRPRRAMILRLRRLQTWRPFLLAVRRVARTLSRFRAGTTMPADTREKGRIFRWAVWALAVVVFLFVLVSVVFYCLARSATSRWERLASELRAKGQSLTFTEIEARRGGIADESNGAVAIREAGQVLESVTEPDESGVLLLDRECKADFFRGIERRCLPPTRKYVEARRQALAELSALTRYADIRLNVSYEGTTLETSTKVLKISSQHRALAKLVTIDAVLKIIDGDVSAAVDAIVAQLRLSEPLYTEPEPILPLAAIASDWLAVTTFEGLLQTRELRDDELERLQLEWKRHVRHQILRPSLLGLRASFIRMTDEDQVMADARAALAAAKVPPKKRWRLPSPVDWMPFKDDWFLYENRFQGVTILTRILDASDDLSSLLAVARREQASLPRFAPGRTLIRIMLPSLTRGIELHARTAARFRCVPVAIAAERFRFANGRFPNAPDELVPNYLATLPRDPFDGKPIRFAKTDSGIVVYSVGENTIDDGGQVVPQEGERLGRDFGVRLVEPSKRVLRLIDNAAPDDQ